MGKYWRNNIDSRESVREYKKLERANRVQMVGLWIYLVVLIAATLFVIITA